MKIRKYISFTLAVCLLCSVLCACTDSGAAEPPQSPAEAAASEAPEAEPSPSPVHETAPESSSEPTEAPSLGQTISDYAKQFEGFKYVYGAENPDTGFDCSGLIYYVFRQFGYRLNRVAKDQNTDGEKIESVDELLPGDIVLFSNGGAINHCGIYLGNDLFIHAMDSEHGVVITSLSEWASTRKLYMRRIVGSDMPVYTQEEVEALDEADRQYQEWLRSQPTPTPTPAGPRPGVSDTPETPYVPTPTPAPTEEPFEEEPPVEESAPENTENTEIPESE